MKTQNWVRDWFLRVTESATQRLEKNEDNVDILTSFGIKLLPVLIYQLSLSNRDWLESPVVGAYRQLLEFNNNNMDKERISVTDLSPEVDLDLKTWYEQESQGIPEENRIKLESDQLRNVNLQKQWSQRVKDTKQERLGYNTGRPAVSLLTLEKAV